MNFSNEDIFNFLIDPLKSNPHFILYPVDDNDELVIKGSDIPIAAVFLYGFDTEPFIAFSKYVTTIYLEHANFTNWSCEAYSPTDKTKYPYSGCDAFMFVDNNYKKIINIDETYGRVVYDGTLCNKTHEEILRLILKLIIQITSANKIEIEIGAPCKISVINKDGNKGEIDSNELRFICM